VTDATADLLEQAAERIDAAPGTNVLDALRLSLPDGATRRDQAVRDQLAGDAYYALLDYLPAHVELLAAWSDREMPDLVASTLRRCARTVRKGGPARIEDQPPIPAPAAVTSLVERAEHGNRRPRKAPEFGSPELRLRHRRGVLASVLTRQQKAKHPAPAKILETELAIGEIDRQLAELDADAPAEQATGTGGSWSGL
jgi:hypothetical protein